METIKSIHHISATVGDPNENLHFYRDILGLRLIKKTVNFEDETGYHLYFANQRAESGSIITFFPREDNLLGRVGAGQARRILFSIPNGSHKYWQERLARFKVDYEETELFDAPLLYFKDPHNLSLALVETKEEGAKEDILGFYGIELLSEKPDDTTNFLIKKMGLSLMEINPDYYQLEMAGIEKHQIFVNRSEIKRGRLGIGTVHHVAFTVPNREHLIQWKTKIEEKRSVTDIHDRKYFASAYFRDPGHIIYELATRGPGFLVDESFDELGSQLMLPEKYEAQRQKIEAKLPKLN